MVKNDEKKKTTTHAGFISMNKTNQKLFHLWIFGSTV